MIAALRAALLAELHAACRALHAAWLRYRIAAARAYLRTVDDAHPLCSAIWAGHLLQIAEWEIQLGRIEA